MPVMWSAFDAESKESEALFEQKQLRDTRGRVYVDTRGWKQCAGRFGEKFKIRE
ncbi:hypothetical protein K0M31_003742, partial [Melipona bicolor]